jgi:hypothetical protein
MDEIQKVREIFLTDLDEETRADNEAKIREWEEQIIRNQAYLDWREHDITTEINKMVRQAYKEHAMALASNRTLTEEERKALWAKQDACLFILSLTDQNAKSALESVLREIRQVLS